MGRKKKYNWEKVQIFYDNYNSLSDCVKKFGMSKRTLDRAKERGDLKTRPQRLPIEHYLTLGRKTSRNYLKKRILQEGLLENKCSECGQGPKWRGRILHMHIDHINGDRYDNRLENLRMLCPNCDQIQDTFAGRNRGNYPKKTKRKK